MTVTLILCKNPYQPLVDREVEVIRPGARLSTVLRQRGYLKGRGQKTIRPMPFVVAINGEYVLQKTWTRRLRASDQVAIIHVPRGGGGSNPLRIVAMIALVVVAAYTGGAVGAAYGPAWGAAASAAITITGTLLLNMLFPVRQTPLSLGGDDTQISQTYTFGQQSNTARLLQAIPVLYGRHRIFPNLASRPYTENRANQQYIYQLFCITQGQAEIENIKIDDADIDTFGEVEYQIVQPGQAVTLFPDNVVSSIAVENLEMFGPDQSQFEILGPFPTNPPNTETNYIAVDLSFPQGIYQMTLDAKAAAFSAAYRFEYQQIDDDGNAIGPWNILVQRTKTMTNRSGVLVSEKVQVSPGRYQVRGYRTNNVGDASFNMSRMVWTGLRGYLQSEANYGNVTLLAMIVRATNNLNGSLARRINVIAKRKLPTWNPTDGWMPETATSSIAWAAADMIRNTDYGRGLPDSAYSLQELYRLDQVWAARGDTFNGVFDTTSQFWDALTEVLACGRAIPMYYAGLIDFIRNEPKTLPTAIFGPQNMIAGTFNTQYIFPETDSPDHVVVKYVDENTWSESQVKCVLPGMTSLNPAEVTIRGITNRAQAWREGMSLAAKNRDQRRLISFSTGREGLIPRYGSLAALSHDVVGWGQTGKVETIVKQVDTAVLTLSEDVRFTEGENHFIAFKRRNGGVDGPYAVVPGPNGLPNEIEISGTEEAIAGLYISNGVREDLTQYQFGPGERRSLLALMMSAAPARDKTVALTFVNYAESVHTAENGGTVPAPPPVSDLPTTPVVPIVDTIELVATPFVNQQNISISPARGANYYEYEISSDGVSWAALASTVETTVQVNLAPGVWWVRARAVGQVPGPWATWTGTIEATTLPLSEISLLTASTDGLFLIDLAWALTPNPITTEVELKWGPMNNLTEATGGITLPVPVSSYTLNNQEPGVNMYFWIRAIDEAGRPGPWYDGATPVVGRATSDPAKLQTILSGQIDETWLSQALREEIESGGGASVEVEAIKNELAAMYTIKTQLTTGGRTVVAGIGVGVENNEGILESQVLVLADRFAVIDPSNDANAIAPFIIDDGKVYMTAAFIQDGTITSAKIGEFIQSDNFVDGTSGWRLTKDGEFQINSSLPGGGRMRITPLNIIVYDENDVDRVTVGYLP